MKGSRIKRGILVFICVAILFLCVQGWTVIDSPINKKAAMEAGKASGIASKKGGLESAIKDDFKPFIRITLFFNPKLYYGNGNAAYYPSYAIWIEDSESGNKRTLYATKKAAKSFGNGYRKESLPVWFGIREKEFDSDKKKVDAVSGATQSGEKAVLSYPIPKEYRNKKINIFIEANISFDFNEYYKKWDESDPLSSVANGQPSLIWKAALETDEKPKDSIPLSIVGHGNVIGSNDKVDNDISQITTAKDIFSSIKLEYGMPK